MKYLVFTLTTFLFLSTELFAQWSSGRPDGHAPIQIMADHTHGKGEFMVSYRFMFMDMDGNRDGTDLLSNSDVLRPNGQYAVVPDQMPMYMHMIGAMYAVSDELTVMAMIPYIQNEMDHITAMGGAFTTSSSGLGDISVSALYKFYQQNNNRAHFQFGLALPTGDIEARDDTPMGDNSLLPYPMQIGTGSYTFIPGVTFLGQSASFSWGAQASGRIRLNDNDNGYRLGDQGKLAGWLGWKATNWLSPQLSASFNAWQDISGADSRYSMALENDVIHTVDPDLKGGTRLDLGVGLNIFVPSGMLKDIRVAVNYDLPVYQNLDGPQMNMEGILTAGIQYTF